MNKFRPFSYSRRINLRLYFFERDIWSIRNDGVAADRHSRGDFSRVVRVERACESAVWSFYRQYAAEFCYAQKDLKHNCSTHLKTIEKIYMI